MFSEMINRLQAGELTPSPDLKNRLSAAIIKKMGILKMAPVLWPGDPKINPPIEHLLWAAVVLEDRDSFQLVREMAITEVYEKRQAGGSGGPVDARLQARSLTDKLLAQLPNENAREKLAGKIKKMI